MALASVGFFASQSEKTATSSYITTVESSIAAGELLIMVIAKDNTSLTDADNSEVTSCSVGSNSMTKLHEWTQNSGGTNTGANVSIWYKQNAAAVNSGVTITASFAAVSAARALVGWRFSMDNNSFTIAEAAFTIDTDDVSAVDTLTVTGLTERQYLIVRGIASEDNSTTFSATTGYTQFNLVGATSSGGAGTANMRASAEFKIATVTTDFSRPLVATADQVNIYFALYELTIGAAPPAAGIKRMLLGVGL